MSAGGEDARDLSCEAHEAATSETIIEGMRVDVLRRLPRLLKKAVAAYEALALMESSGNAKEFAAYQANCKAALAHVHLLIKLADWARKVPRPDVDGEFAENVETLISEAESALSLIPTSSEATS